MPEPLSLEVEERIASQFPESDRADAAQALLDYRVAPINFGRLRILEAAAGNTADLICFVAVANRYGEDWAMDCGQSE